MKKILLLDDFESALFITEFTLNQIGYKTEKASTGTEALAKLQQQKFDLIISDFNMPTMNGLEFTKKAKQLPGYFQTPVFILSTEKNPDVKSKAYEAGVTMGIKKPFQIEELKRLVARVLK